MEEHLKLLVQMQNFDTAIEQLERERNTFHQEVERFSLETREREEKLLKEKERLTELELTRRNKERDLEVENQRITKSQERLNEAKTSREYEAAQKEITQAKDARARLEEEILSLMEETEQWQEKLKKEEETIKEQKEILKEREASVKVKMDEINQELSRREEVKNKIVQMIDPKLLKQYRFLYQHRQKIAVVPASNGVCQGCYMNIAPQLLNELRSGVRQITCPSCQRILYWEQKEDNQDVSV